MSIKNLFLLLPFLFMRLGLYAQSCTTIGQNPGSAFPVCGTTVFSQNNVPICSNAVVPVTMCQSGGYPAVNPFWYKFTCYTSGTLKFLITPNDLGDDYDWQLFDITGHNPTDVFTNSSLFVTGNWSGSSGTTGASSAGVGNIQCGSDPAANIPRFSVPPDLKQGHNYVLLISHYTVSQSGYTLSFSGGTADITDPNKPKLLSAYASCDPNWLNVNISKQVRCNSLSADGSDFLVSAPGYAVNSATGLGCTAGFDLNTVKLGFDHPLTPGDYYVTIKNGNDGNTLLDYCDNDIPAGDTIHFTILPIPPPTPFDSIAPVGCAPGSLQLVFKKPVRCSSIAADGSDFKVIGPTPVIVLGASGNCGLSEGSLSVTVNLNAPLLTGGLYSIQLVQGSDGNTIIDECGQETPSASLDFVVSDTVNASFGYRLFYGCAYDTVLFTQDGRNGINNWQWKFDSSLTSTQQNPEILFPDFGLKHVQLIVSNGVCSDTATMPVLLDNVLKADFDATDSLCPKDKAEFKDKSIGNIVSWYWDFGDGTSSSGQTPFEKSYPVTGTEKNYPVSLVVQNNLGCKDTLIKQVKTLRNCYIAVPSAFTPNGDGINDFLYPLNAYKAVDLEFRVFNRYGQMVFETKNWTKKWDGKINGHSQPTGTYAWMLQYTDGETGKKVFLKGTTVLIR